MVLFPLPLPEAWEYFFPRYLLWESGQAPRGKSLNIMHLPWLGPPGVLKSETCPHCAFSTSSIAVQVYYPCTSSRGSFCLQLSVPVSCDPLCFSLSTILVAVFCPVSSLMDPGRVVDFSVCFSFLHIVWQSGKLPTSLHTELSTLS